MTNNTNALTAETITTEQIEALGRESAGHDPEMHAICLLAIDGNVESIRTTIGDRGLRAVDGMTQEEAREECADAINAARAME